MSSSSGRSDRSRRLDVIDRHGAEAAFLWLLRSDAIQAPHYRIGQLARLDARLDGHIDGLRIAGDDGWEIAARALAWKEPAEVFTAAVLAFESGTRKRIDAVFGVASQDPGLSRGAISALGWLTLEQARPHIDRLIQMEDASLRRIGLRAAAVHRWAAGAAFESAVMSSTFPIVSAAARAAGELCDPRLTSACQAHLNSVDPECRFWAAWSSAVTGNRAAVPILQEVATSRNARSLIALDAVARRLSPDDAISWWRQLVPLTESLGTAVVLAGRIGDPRLVPWLLDQMSVPALARRAGEAFTLITGVDLAYQNLEGEWPDGFSVGPTEDPEDSDVAMDADANLPWPDPVLVGKWWTQNHNRFRAGVRHLLGQPITPDSMQQVLRKGNQRQRAAAAIELHILHPEQPLFEIRARGLYQRRLLD